MTTVAIYTRLSQDPSGQQTAMHRQEAACRSFAAARGWMVSAAFEDADVSAYRRQPRPGFELLSASIAGRQLDGVLVWKLDRLVRRPAEFEQFWQLCERSGAFLASATEPIDTSTELGLTVVRVLVAFANMESATTSLRLRAREHEAALAGKPRIRTKAFGYTRDYAAIVPHEASLIHEAARGVLGGESLRSIALDWTARGLKSPRNKDWSAQTLRQMLLSPRLTANRAYHGKVVAKGQWPRILDDLTAARLREVLGDPDRRPPPQWARYLLSRGFLTCGNCGRTLKGGAKEGVRFYKCANKPAGCNGIAVNADRVDDHVTNAVLTYLKRGAHLYVRHNTSTATELERLAEIVAVEQAMREANRDYYAERHMSRDEYLAVHQTLTQRLKMLRRELGLGVLISLPSNGLDEAWREWPLTRRRAVIRSVVDQITIAPARRTTDPANRISIVWTTPTDT